MGSNRITSYNVCYTKLLRKLYAYWTTVNYREAYGMHASNGIRNNFV